jgi:hypothetical protein
MPKNIPNKDNITLYGHRTSQTRTVYAGVMCKEEK